MRVLVAQPQALLHAPYGRSIAGEPLLIDKRRIQGLIRNLDDKTPRGEQPLASYSSGTREDDLGFRIIDGVAHIPITGLIVKDRFTAWWYCGTSTIDTQIAISRALAHPDVEAIVLDIDSPGGTVSGTQELADAVFAAKQEKPIHAHVSDLCASAAYWIGSQASSMAANQTAQVGSIGVFTVIRDWSKALEDAGIATYLIRSGDLKGTGTFGAQISDDEIAAEQAVIDETARLFVEAVARGRGMPASRVSTLATGQVWVGAQALEVGLIDTVRSAQATHDAVAGDEMSIQALTNALEKLDPSARKALGKALLASDDSDAGTQDPSAEEEEEEEEEDPEEPMGEDEEDEEEEDEEEAQSSLALRAQLERERAERARYEVRLANLERAQKEERYLAEAKRYDAVPGNSAKELAAALAEVDKKLSKDAAKAIRARLAGGAGLLRESAAFLPQGSITHDADSPDGRLRAIADRIQTNEQVSAVEAMDLAMQRNPGIYEAQVRASMQRNRN